MIKKKQRQRIARAAAIDKKRAMAGGVAGASMGRRTSKDGSDLDDYGYGRTPQPTLPQVSLDDDDYQDDIKLRAKIKAEKAGMNFPSSTPGPNEYPPAPPAMGGEYGVYQDYGSSTNLVGNAAPLGISYPPSVVTPGPSGGPVPSHSNSMSSLPSLPSYSSVNVNAEIRQQQAPPPLPHSSSLRSINRYNPGGQGQPSGRLSPYDRHDQYGHYDQYDSYDSYTQDYFSHPLTVQPPLPSASQPQPQLYSTSSSSSTSQPYTVSSYQLLSQPRVGNEQGSMMAGGYQGYIPSPTPGYTTRDQYLYDTGSSAYGGYGGR